MDVADTEVTILNVGGLTRSPRGIEELVKSLFRVPNCSAEHRTLCEVMSRYIGVAKDELHLLTLLEQALENVPAYHEMCETVRQLKLETQDNCMAYRADSSKYPSAVFWPDPTFSKNPGSLFATLPVARRKPLITKDTRIGSAGSCFATEIALQLQRHGYNYLAIEREEDNLNEEGFVNAPARWGIIFNTPSFRQLIERSFNVRETPKILWENQVSGKVKYFDPFREDIIFDSIEEYEANYVSHRAAARQALAEAEVFVLTLGVNEVWKLRSDGSVFSRCPWNVSPALVESHVMTVEENVDELELMLKTWREFNPGVKLIVTVSPVPLHATFRGDDTHVVESNAHSKATLRVAAESFAQRNRDVFYFPSYEMVTFGSVDPWTTDQRHVKRRTVEGVMALFDVMFFDHSMNAEDLKEDICSKIAENLSEGDFKGVVYETRRLLGLGDSSIEVWETFAFALEKLERWEEAVHIWEVILSRDPTNQVMKQRLSNLKRKQAQAILREASQVIYNTEDSTRPGL